MSRLVEENRVDESVLSMVRCLYFVDTFVRDGKASISGVFCAASLSYCNLCYCNLISVVYKVNRTFKWISLNICFLSLFW